MDNHYYIIYPYYDNPKMLERQVENWNRYSGALQAKVTFILVDDASPNHPALPIFKNLRHRKRLFRVLENVPWAQHHARNIGAHEVAGDNPWLMMSDMDIIITPEAMNDIVEKAVNPARYHTFDRHFVGNEHEPKYHCNTFLVKKKNYWAVNGYDCDFCGGYGGDGEFLRQLSVVAPQIHHGSHSKHLKHYVECTDDPIVLWGCEYNIEDANTKEFGRKGTEYQDRYKKIFNEKRARGDMRSKDPIRWPYEEITI